MVCLPIFIFDCPVLIDALNKGQPITSLIIGLCVAVLFLCSVVTYYCCCKPEQKEEAKKVNVKKGDVDVEARIGWGL